jgi:hypothetical protein
MLPGFLLGDFDDQGGVAPGHMKVDTFGKLDLPTLLAMKLD